jgi:hypothetical protein
LHDNDPPKTSPVVLLRWLYSCPVRPAISCILQAITFGPVSLIRRWT